MAKVIVTVIMFKIFLMYDNDEVNNNDTNITMIISNKHKEFGLLGSGESTHCEGKGCEHKTKQKRHRQNRARTILLFISIVLFS